tara:strand:- start:53 stop:418 length:366 start_codon:yes stop_codon:yes gene_type:complete
MKTIICDIDGTLVKYTGEGHLGIMKIEHELLPGVYRRMRRWEVQGHRIILITGRRESIRERTEYELRRLGIPFDMLLMGYADSGRILINDVGPKVKAHAVNVPRDEGWDDADWESVGLDNA